MLPDPPRPKPSWGSWGEGHLALDAIVAFVDDELSPGARHRATEHLAGCRDCTAEVLAQLQARSAIRRATAPTLPVSLLDTLRSIPEQAELPPPPPGLAVGQEGGLVSMLRDPPEPGGSPPAQSGRSSAARLLRFGASAVAGLALGALFAGPSPFSAQPTAPDEDRSDVLDSRLQIGPAAPVELRHTADPGAGPTSTVPPAR